MPRKRELRWLATILLNLSVFGILQGPRIPYFLSGRTKKSGQDKQALGVTVPLSSGLIYTLSMSSRAVKNQPKQKNRSAMAQPDPPPFAVLFYIKVNSLCLQNYSLKFSEQLTSF